MFRDGRYTLKQCFVFALNGAKDCLVYKFKAVHILTILDASTSIVMYVLVRTRASLRQCCELLLCDVLLKPQFIGSTA